MSDHKDEQPNPAIRHRTLYAKKDPERAVITPRMDLICDAMPEGVMIVDRDWTFSYVNRLAIETLNIPILGQKFFELASSISHKINNPLEAITNLLYLIALSEGLPPELKGYVQSAQAKLSRVSQIATQTLRFHRQAVAPRW